MVHTDRFPLAGELPPQGAEKQRPRVPIAVARDEAFCFTYAETLEALERAGAELCWFSPLQDSALPEQIGGLYLPGGYPELYAGQLSANRSMLASVRRAVERGLPTVAECGGFLYLGQSWRMPAGNAGPWQAFCRGRASGWGAGAVRIRGIDCPRRQYAVPRRGASARARVPPLGFHRQRHRLYRRKAQREAMGLRLCK